MNHPTAALRSEHARLCPICPSRAPGSACNADRWAWIDLCRASGRWPYSGYATLGMVRAVGVWRWQLERTGPCVVVTPLDRDAADEWMWMIDNSIGEMRYEDYVWVLLLPLFMERFVPGF